MANDKPTGKKRVAISFHNLSPELQDECRKKYPGGFTDSMIRIDKAPGDFFYVVEFETEDTKYLVKIDVKVDGSAFDDDDEKEYFDDDIKGAEEIIDGSSEEDADEE